jgi:hypothetical protein
MMKFPEVKYDVLPSGQRSYYPPMRFDIVHGAERLYMWPEDVTVPFDTKEIAEQWIIDRVDENKRGEYTVLEIPNNVEPMWYVELRNEVKPGVFVENCSCQVVEVISVDYDSGHMHCVSAHNGQRSDCDLYHCGIVVLSPEEVERKKAIYVNAGGGEAGLRALGEDWVARCCEQEET